MLIYRALNEDDFDINVFENGLFSKANINDALQKVIDTAIIGDNIELIDKQYKENFNYYREENPTLSGYNIIGIMQSAIDKQDRLNYLREGFNSNMDNPSLKDEYRDAILDILASKNAHILHGSNGDYDWISFTKDLNIFLKYYLGQKRRHMGVCMNSNIVNYLFDGDMLAADMSNIDVIENSGIISNKKDREGIYKETDINSRVIRYALADKEVLYYNYIPRERLMFLEPLQVDMLYNDMFNYKYFEAPDVLRKHSYQMITDWLWEQLERYPRTYQFIYNALYNKRMTIEEVNKEFGTDIIGALDIKREILELLDQMDGEKYFKKKCDGEVKVLELDRNIRR